MPGADGRTGADQPVNTRRVQGPHRGSTATEAGIVARSALQAYGPIPPFMCSFSGTPERRGPPPGRTRWQSGSQLRLTSRTDGSTPVWFNGRTPAFQAGNAGPIPVTGSRAWARRTSTFCVGSPEQTGRDGQHGPPASTGGSICDSLERHWPQPGGIPGTLKKKGWTIWQKQNGLGQTVPGRSSRHGDSAGRTSPTRTGC